ncbi:MAG: hypothetical protein ACR2P4_05965 [Gammaproteobacteria bacterium]
MEDITKNNTNDNSDNTAANLRADHLPPFVNGEWVEIQIRVGAPNKQRQIAAHLAAKYGNWKGEEQDGVFYDKVAADLAIPGFIDDVMKGAADKGKKPKKPPFWFILERFIHAGGGQKKDGFGESYSRAMAATKQKEDWDSFRDLAFFAALWLRTPEKVAGDIADTPVQAELAPFLASFTEKDAEERKQKQAATVDAARNVWKGYLIVMGNALIGWANEEPDPGKAAKMHEFAEQVEEAALKYGQTRNKVQKAQTIDALQTAADALAKTAEESPDIRAVRDALLQCIKEGGCMASPDDIGAQTDALVKLGEQTTGLRRKVKDATDAKDNDAAAKHGAVLSSASAETRECAAKLLKTIGAQAGLPPEEEFLPPPPPPMPLPEQQTQQPKKQAQPADKTAAEKHADKINATAVHLILQGAHEEPTLAGDLVNVAKVDITNSGNSGIEPAYRIIKGAETQMPDVAFVFPAAALRLLAKPHEGGRQETMDDLDAAVKRGVDEVGKMAVFAAALFPAVFFYDARGFFRDNGPLADCGERLEPLRQLVCDFGTWRVSPAVFSAAARGDGPGARAQLKEWYESNKDKTIKYAGATHIWHDWMKPEGVLGAVIGALLGGGEKALAMADAFSHEYRSERAVQRLMDAGSAQFAEKKIEGGAKHRMLELFHDGAGLMEKAAEELRHHGEGDSDELREKCRHFLSGLQRVREAKKPKTPDDSSRAAEECLHHAFGFFTPEKATKIATTDPNEETTPS